jgi:hypothetical protein
MTGTTRGRAAHVALAAAALTTALAAVAALSGCGSGSGSGGHRLTVRGLAARARPAGKGEARTCPVPFRIAAAAKAAGITGSAHTASGNDAVNAATGDNEDKGSAGAKQGATVLTCSYRVKGSDVDVRVVGVRRGNALSLMMPRVAADSGLGRGQLESYYSSVLNTRRGKPVLTDPGNVAAVRLRVSGPGDLALFVTADVLTSGELDAHPAIEPAQVRELAAALAAQARW